MEFEVRPGKLNGIAASEREIRDSLNTYNSQLDTCRNALRSCLSSSASSTINSAINSARSRIGVSASKIGIMGDKLDTIATMYTRTESKLANNHITAETVTAAKSYNADGSVKEEKTWTGAKIAKSTARWILNHEIKKYVNMKKTADRIVNDVKSIYNNLKESYDNHGTFYYVVEYGKIAVKAVCASAKIAAAITVIAGTGGIATVPAICAILGGMNEIWNLASDIINIHSQNYDQVGKSNVLKSTLEDLGNKIGGETGAVIGSYTYYGIDLVGSVFTLVESLGGLDKLKSYDPSKMATEVKEIGKAVKSTSITSVLNSSIQDLRYQYTLAKYAYPETVKFMENVGLLYTVTDKLKSTIEKEYIFIHNGEKTDAFDTYNSVNDIYGNSKKAVKTVTKLDDWYNDIFNAHAKAY